MEHWFFLCIHLTFVIDRIEPPYAVVEWADSGAFSDIERTLLPGNAAEGDAWMLHLRPNPEGSAHSNATKPAISTSAKPVWLPDAAVPKTHKTYRYRFSRISFQQTRSWR